MSCRRSGPHTAVVAVLLSGALGVACAMPAAGAPLSMRVEYADSGDTGFGDPQLGAARRTAFEHAVSLWSSWLAGEQEVVLLARMPPRGGDERSALLASAGSVSAHRRFAGSLPSTWYPAALANQLAGADLNGADAEIAISFNADIDGPVLGGTSWYYGLDAQPGADVDFVTIALHEIGHGLGFFDLIDPTSGGSAIAGAGPPHLGIFERFLLRPGAGRLFDMRDAERLAAITSGQVVWNGGHVLEALRRPAPMYAPLPYLGGSSLSHWDVSSDPDELLEPFYLAANHDPGLLLPALLDLGWRLNVATPTPRSTVPIETTPTAQPTPTATPTIATQRRRSLALVSNFDGRTLTVLNALAHQVVDTITVGDGPLDVAVSPDGRRIFVTAFHAGALVEIDAQQLRRRAVIAVGDSAHGVAVAPDGRRAFVTDTFAGQVHVIDLEQRRRVDSFPVGRQPGQIAMAADGHRVIVADYGGPLALADPALRGTVALIDARTTFRFGALGLALAEDRLDGALTFETGDLVTLNLRRLDFSPILLSFPLGTLEAVTFGLDRRTLFVAGHYADGSGQVGRVTGDQLTNRVSVGDVPQALALRPDGAILYVANTGSDSLSVVETQQHTVIDTVAVGRAPMDVAFAAVPPPRCAGDCGDRGQVSIDDLLIALGIALGHHPLARCAAADADGLGDVTIDEILLATRHALRGCP